MAYTVGETARMLHVPASTLRYYDKEGLLPSVERTSGGIRMFKDDDIEWLRIIDCLKKSGMSIRDIREYIALVAQGDSTINERLQLFYRQREILKAQMRECWFYETAKEAGTVEVPQQMAAEELPERFRSVRAQLQEL